MIGRGARRALHLARRLVVLEIGIWRSLALWTLRRVPGRTPGARTFTYAKEVTPVLLAFVFVSALELPVVHLLIPWETVRLALLVLGVWGLLWMAGYLAALRVHQHVLDDRGLRIRSGTRLDLPIAWEQVADVRVVRGRTPSDHTVVVEGTRADVPMLKQVRVAVRLTGPTPVALPAGEHVLEEVRFYADDPKALVAAAREHLGRQAEGVVGPEGWAPASRS
jgi:hypothetical protein